MAKEEAQKSTDTAFWACDLPLTNVASFRYLGNLVIATDDECLAVVANYWKDSKKCVHISSILGR